VLDAVSTPALAEAALHVAVTSRWRGLITQESIVTVVVNMIVAVMGDPAVVHAHRQQLPGARFRARPPFELPEVPIAISPRVCLLAEPE